MNFDLTQEEAALTGRVRTLLSDGSLPDLESLEDAPAGEAEAALRRWLLRLGEAGFLASGAGASRRAELVALLCAQMELARRSPALLFCTEVGVRLLASLLADHGTEQQREQLLPSLLSGRWIVASAISEPLSGSTVTAFATKAKAIPEGFSLTGEKSYVGLAPMADLLAIFGQLDGGPAVFLVPRDAAGLSVGERIPTLGYRILFTSPLRLSEVKVPAERVIRPAPGTDLAAEALRAQDAAATAASLGILRLCFEESQRSANAPKADGRPSARYQAVRFGLAEMLAMTQTAELLAYRAASLRALGDPEAETVALCAKIFATETACHESERALQILAAAGYRQDQPAQRAFRNARLGPILGHTSEVARLAVASQVLARMVRS